MQDQSARSFQLTGFAKPLSESVHPTPTPQGTEVLIRVKGAGVCHSDLHVQDGHYDMGGGEQLSFEGRIKFPLTLGHETAGEVVSFGSEAQGVTVGSNMLVCSWIGCGTCATCLDGQDHLCATPAFLGANKQGGYSDYVIVPHPRYLIEIGDLSPAVAAPLSCSGLTTYSAIRKFGSILDTVPLVIMGAGGLGMMAIGLLDKLNMPAPIIVEIDKVKREAAIAAGAAHAVDPTDDDAIAQIQKAVGQPVLAILDLVGAGQTATLAIQLVAKGGRIVVVGLLGGDVRIPVPMIPMKSMIIQGSYVGSPAELRELVGIVLERGMPDVPLDCRPLDQADAALNDLRAGKVLGRVVLIP